MKKNGLTIDEILNKGSEQTEKKEEKVIVDQKGEKQEEKLEDNKVEENANAEKGKNISDEFMSSSKKNEIDLQIEKSLEEVHSFKVNSIEEVIKAGEGDPEIPLGDNIRERIATAEANGVNCDELKKMLNDSENTKLKKEEKSSPIIINKEKDKINKIRNDKKEEKKDENNFSKITVSEVESRKRFKPTKSLKDFMKSRRQKGKYVELFLPASNMLVRFYGINTISKKIELVNGIRSVPTIMESIDNLRLIYDFSEVRSKDGHKLSFEQFISRIAWLDKEILYMGALMATSREDMINTNQDCPNDGYKHRGTTSLLELYKSTLNDAVREKLGKYDALLDIDKLQEDAMMGKEFKIAGEDEFCDYEITYAIPDMAKGLYLGEGFKEYLVDKFYDYIPVHLRRDNIPINKKINEIVNNASDEVNTLVNYVDVVTYIEEIKIRDKTTNECYIINGEERDGEEGGLVTMIETLKELPDDINDMIMKDISKSIDGMRTIFYTTFLCRKCKNEIQTLFEPKTYLFFIAALDLHKRK